MEFEFEYFAFCSSVYFQSGDKNDPSNYWTIMISPLLAKLYGIILEKKINEWLEMEGKRAKGQVGFRRNHSTTDHLVTLRFIAVECRNNKFDLFCCFVDFRKAFDIVPRNNPWNRLEELKIHFELRAIEITVYEMSFPSLRKMKGGQHI